MAIQDDSDRTSARQLRLKDRLWRTFELMAEEQEKSIDDLVNDAMSAYAQLAGYETTVNMETPTPFQAAAPPVAAHDNVVRPSRAPQPSLPPAPARMGRPTAAAIATERPSFPAPPPIEGSAAATAILYLMFDGQKYRIDKDQFIIGRGSKSSDLPIKDGNISRKHAAVIRRNGSFFIKDLGSTNGIDFKGMRIDNKRIDEGDVFHICEYELKFTYKR